MHETDFLFYILTLLFFIDIIVYPVNKSCVLLPMGILGQSGAVLLYYIFNDVL
jgi:hypothetical protein